MAAKKSNTRWKAKAKNTPKPPPATKKKTRAKTAPKRSREEREAALVRIAAYHVRGMTQAQIAEREGVSQQAISRDIADIKQRWRDSTVIDHNELVNKHMAALDEMEREYWAAWERSQESRKTVKQRKSDMPGRVAELKEMIQSESCGDAKYLDGVRRCWIDRRDTIGYGAAQKVEATVAQGPTADMTEEEIDARLREYYESRKAKASEANDE